MTTTHLTTQPRALECIHTLYKTNDIAHAMLDNLYTAFETGDGGKHGKLLAFVRDTLGAFYGRNLVGEEWCALQDMFSVTLEAYCVSRYNFEHATEWR